MTSAPDSSGTPPGPNGLRSLIDERLTNFALDDEALAFLLAALGEGEGEEKGEGEAAPGGSGHAPRAYLRSVTVGGFRGVGRTARLPLKPGPGLTVITGRNGCGKSSFAEGIEIALTGDNARWRGRTDIWRKSWRNLHDGEQPQVAVEFMVEGDTEPTTVLRTWHGDDVADSEAELERPGTDPAPLGSLGWDADLSTYRPFLSYSELGQMISGRPSEMYDAVASILGLEQLADAAQRLRDLARDLDAPAKRAAAELPELLERLRATDDPRADSAEAALAGRVKNLALITDLTSGTRTADGDELAELRRRVELTGPDVTAVAESVARLREALASAEDVKDTSAEDARLRADLLERAHPPGRTPRDRRVPGLRQRGQARRGVGAAGRRASTAAARGGVGGARRAPGARIRRNRGPTAGHAAAGLARTRTGGGVGRVARVPRFRRPAHPRRSRPARRDAGCRRVPGHRCGGGQASRGPGRGVAGDGGRAGGLAGCRPRGGVGGSTAEAGQGRAEVAPFGP